MKQASNNVRASLIASGLVRTEPGRPAVAAKPHTPRRDNDATIAAKKKATQRALAILQAAVAR